VTINHNLHYEPIRPSNLPPLPKVAQIAMLVDDENYSQVDLYAQHILRVLPNDPHANLAIAWVAARFGFYDHLQMSFNTASQSNNGVNNGRPLELLARDLHIDLSKLIEKISSIPSTVINQFSTRNKKTHFHIAKAWGFGFGSEMSALMGQAYMAEAMNRELIVHWGSNFLFHLSGKKKIYYWKT